MPLKDSTETKMGCQERREGRMGSWSDLVWIIHGRKLESAAFPGPLIRDPWGRGSSWPLRTA
ncbi:hypothetical protein CDL12_09353 [Handroanthus impetiginosus]|uniref:Uncharacterized protein n=1 Tax=Handroanthus impetiginosus TaxID=429701 RepID=A0A2G9HKM3_9LAMI|nr:hypothetical protein CDL12_09353 [Handroanthus impetiginosus]